MRRKILTALLTTLAATACALGLAACKTDPTDSQSPSGQTSSSDISAPADSSAPQWGDVYTVETAYEKASELGYAGSLEEFIQMISGKDGQDGKDGIDGKDGADGKDGRGIREVSVNQKGELVVAFTDGTSVTLDLDCPHRYSEWMIIAEPNCTSLGVKMRRCEICGDTEYDFSKATEHVWDDGFVLSEPTCTEDGQAVHVCEECGVMKLQTLEAKGHRYENCVCTVCGEIDVENMFVFTPTEKGTYAVALADDLKPTIKSVVIPSEYAGTRVTEIANSAFANCSNLAVIDIPDTVEKIGESAFFASGIESVVIPDSVTEIGSYAFANCENLTEVSLGNNVEVIGRQAFAYTAVKYIYFPRDVREIGAGAFLSCTRLENLTFYDGINAYLKTIGDSAFRLCALKEVWIPLNATDVAENAFDDGVTIHIMQEDLNFRSFTSEDGSVSYEVKVDVNNRDITEAVIPAVYNGLPVTRIADSGFGRCENLVSVTIPDSVTEIGNYAFAMCHSLKSITIPRSVTKIGRFIFLRRSCTALEALSVEEGNPVYHSDGNCIIETATNTLLFGCKASVIPDDGSVTKIGERAFYFSSVESIVIPDTVTEIGNLAFAKCENLAEVTLSEGLKTIGRNAFGGCTALKEIEIPASAEEIAENAFGSDTNVIFKEKEEAA
jgi:fibronectin type III domain protein